MATIKLKYVMSDIDRHGNVNLTRTGPADGPPRFRGPGLANISFAVVAMTMFAFVGLESATIPAPACRCATPSSRTIVLIAMHVLSVASSGSA